MTGGSLVVFAACVGFAALLPIPPEYRIHAFAGAVLVSFSFVTVLLLGYGVWKSRRVSAHMDGAFAALGIRGERVSPFGFYNLQYKGDVGGRRLDAYFSKGPTLELFLDANTGTKLAIGRQNAIEQAVRQVRSRQPLQTTAHELQGLAVYPEDPNWAQRLLTEPEIPARIARLFDAPSGGDLRTLQIRPDAVYLHMRHIPIEHIDSDKVWTWVGDLAALAGAAESIPPPANPSQVSELERKSRLDRKTMQRRVSCWIFGCLGALIVGAFGFIVLLQFLLPR